MLHIGIGELSLSLHQLLQHGDRLGDAPLQGWLSLGNPVRYAPPCRSCPLDQANIDQLPDLLVGRVPVHLVDRLVVTVREGVSNPRD